MDLRRPLLVLALLASLTACGDNTDLQRGETNCDSTETSANNPHDASCEETGTNDGNPN
jgi:predicted small lipoprotein YifL